MPRNVNDLRYVRTEAAIIDAFYEIISSKGVNRLTVTAISQAANIDRKTFYLHYDSIDALLRSRAEAFAHSVLDRFHAAWRRGDMESLLSTAMNSLAEGLEDNFEFLSQVIHSVPLDVNVDYLIAPIIEGITNSELVDYRGDKSELEQIIRFYLTGLGGLAVDQIKKGQKIDLSSKLVRDLLSLNGLQPK